MLDSRSDPVSVLVVELKLQSKNNPSALAFDFSSESGNLMPTQICVVGFSSVWRLETSEVARMCTNAYNGTASS